MQTEQDGVTEDGASCSNVSEPSDSEGKAAVASVHRRQQEPSFISEPLTLITLIEGRAQTPGKNTTGRGRQK